MTAGTGDMVGEDHTLDSVTVLLVDDDETWARVTGRLLADNNDALDVTTVNSLEAGREAFERLDPDCVVCDYQLGDGTGLSLLETVRLADADRPFLLVTGRGDEAVASDAIGQGVTDYIRKDQDDDEAGLLASRITRAVRSYRTERALERERRSKTALLDVLTGTTTERDLLQQFCARLVSEREYICAWIGRETGTGPVRPQAVAGQDAYLDAMETPDGALPAEEPARLALDRGESVLVSVGDGRWRALADDHGFEGALATPIRHDGVRLGVLTAYTDDANVLDDPEREAVEEYAETVGYALTNAERKRSLMSGGAVSVRADIDVDSVPLRALTTVLPGDAAVEILSAVPREDGTTLYVTALEGVTDVAFDDVASATDVQSVQVDRSASPTRCELVINAPTPEDTLATHGVVVEQTELNGERMTLSLALPDHELVSTVQQTLTTAFDGANVSTIWTSEGAEEPADDELLASMTDRQRRVLHHALNVGYFERPRGTNATELADHFDITRSTVSQHLRTAQRKVFTRLFPGQESH